MLIHLGYLAYDRDTNRCYIPNKEVAEEMSNAVQATEWSQLAKTLENSQRLLDSTIAGNEQAVAQAIDQIKRMQYPAKIAEYTSDILLIGINYDRKTKLHTCIIERCNKYLKLQLDFAKITKRFGSRMYSHRI